MQTFILFLLAILALILVFIFFVIGIYNSLIRCRNQFKNAYAQIDVQLQRRYELIPNLVETAKKFMKHEQDTLERVIQARNQAMQINLSLADDPANTQMIGQLMEAEKILSQGLAKLMAVAESYPELKSDVTMNNLMEELTSTENKVSFARQAFNDSVMIYNNKVEEFPNNVLAGMFNFSMAKQLQIADEKMKDAVKVDFS